MRSSDMIGWAGFAGILGGMIGILLTPVLTFAGWISGPAGEPPPMLWARMLRPVVMPLIELGAPERAIYLYDRIVFSVYVLFVVALLGLHALLSGRGEHAEELGYWLTLAGLLLNLAGNIADYWLGAFPALEAGEGDRLHDRHDARDAHLHRWLRAARAGGLGYGRLAALGRMGAYSNTPVRHLDAVLGRALHPRQLPPGQQPRLAAAGMGADIQGRGFIHSTQVFHVQALIFRRT